MTIPGVGHVIKYSYLWWDEHYRGQNEGRKERPACVLFNQLTEANDTVLYVLPITHTPTEDPTAVEIPLSTKKRLGLDSEPSWIITSEYNKFTWPGYDIRRCDNGSYSYGILPEFIIKSCVLGFKANAKNSHLRSIARDD